MELEIVKRLRNREEKAYLKIMNLHGNHLLHIAILLVKDHYIAEEVVQDTFVTAFKKIDQLDEAKKLKSWLITITINECRSRMRKWSWKNILLHHDSQSETNIVDENGQGPEEALLITWQNAQLHEAIGELPYKYREVITLYYFEELSIKEIIEMINEKENTIKTRLSRGRRLLKKSIQKGGEEIAK